MCRLYKKKYLSLKNNFINYSNFLFEENISGMESFYKTSVMISDWSGVAFEYAFGLGKPVIFIDMPKKINNSDFKLYKNDPIEINLRQQIGKLVSLQNLKNIVNILNDVYINRETYKDKIIKEREKNIYNLKTSSEKGAEYIYNLIKK